MKYLVTHETRYRYAMPVSVGHNQAFLCPRDLPTQRCMSNDVEFEPGPGSLNARTDYFGNHTTLFTIHEPHAAMRVKAVSEVEVLPHTPWLTGTGLPWEAVRGQLRADRTHGGLDAMQFTFDSPLVRAFPEATRYAQQSFPGGRPILDGVLDLTRRVFKDFKYDPATTTVSTPVAEVLRQRSGVCQDFAHLQIAMLRGLGLAARYVSGYLRTFHMDDDPRKPKRPRLIGADASHAWLSVYDGSHWTDFDPTNNQVVGEHHVTVAWGRDYSDVSPVKGVIVGGGDQEIEVRVSVKPA